MATKLSRSRRRLVDTLRNQHQRLSAIRPKGAAADAGAAAPRKLHHHVWRTLRWIILAAVLAGIGVSLFIAHYSLVPTSLAGIVVHNSTSEVELQRELAGKLKGYTVTIEYPDQTSKTFSPGELGISVDAVQSAKNAMAVKNPANPLKRLRWWGGRIVPLVLKVNEQTLHDFIAAHATQVIAPAQDASIAIDDGVVTVTPAGAGEAYTLPSAAQTLQTAVDHLRGGKLALTKQPLEPAITEDDVAVVAENIRQILSQKASFTIQDQEITATPADIGSWIELSPSPPNHTIDFTVNSGKVLSYMNAIARPYIQPPVSQIVMPAPGGGTTVLIPGRNGVDITNKEAVAADVAKQLLDKQPVAVTLPVQYATFKTITAEPHDKWIVIDTTTKRMYAYEQSNLVRTFLISAGAPQTPTVTGEFKIYAKYPVQDMRGANADGSRYFQPAVKWVNYFYRDYAIHGNYWRPLSYFGNVNSSHGCVGILDPEAEWLYAWAPIGTTVIVHR